MAPFGHQHRHLGLDGARDGHHAFGRCHLEIELDVRKFTQAPHVLVLDVAAVFAQVDGDPVRAAEVRLDCGPYWIGLVGAARLPDGGHVVDVDAQLDHRS